MMEAHSASAFSYYYFLVLQALSINSRLVPGNLIQYQGIAFYILLVVRNKKNSASILASDSENNETPEIDSVMEN